MRGSRILNRSIDLISRKAVPLSPEAMALRGDARARVLMRDRDVLVADCTGRGSPADVDTLEDLERLQQEDQ